MSDSKLSTNDVKHIAKLANLNLTENEISKFQTQLSAILEYVDKLQEVNTDNVEETSQVTGLSNIYHDDQNPPINILKKEDILKVSKHRAGDYFKVPAVIKKK